MFYFSPNNRIIVFLLIKAKIPRYHKEEWNAETADCLYGNSDHSGEFTMHEHHAKAGKPFYEIQTTIVLFHCHSHLYLRRKDNLPFQRFKNSVA